jgi:hypothetical protein
MLHVLVAAMEITVGAGAARSTIDTAYTHRYVPRIAFETTSGGSAGHSLGLSGADGLVVQARVGVELGPRMELELLGCRSTYDLLGPSTPHAIQMHYTSRQPPDYVSRVFQLDAARPWPDAKGHVRQSVVALNLRLHTPAGRPLRLGVSAGPALHHVGGSLASLAYTTFSFGGHSTLVSGMYELGADLPSRWIAGFNVGGEAAVRLGARTALVADVRYFHARQVELDLSVQRIVDARGALLDLSVEEARTRVPLAPLRLRTSFATLSVALRLGL